MVILLAGPAHLEKSWNCNGQVGHAELAAQQRSGGNRLLSQDTDSARTDVLQAPRQQRTLALMGVERKTTSSLNVEGAGEACGSSAILIRTFVHGRGSLHAR